MQSLHVVEKPGLGHRFGVVGRQSFAGLDAGACADKGMPVYGYSVAETMTKAKNEINVTLDRLASRR